MKTYINPQTLVVNVEVQSALMDLSNGGSASISKEAADGDGFVKDSRSDWGSIWE